MAIPPFEATGILPPVWRDRYSPHKTDMLELCQTLGTNSERRQLLHGLLRYRIELRNVGVDRAEQWIDGSFVEDKPQPNDIDVLTLMYEPPPESMGLDELIDRERCLERFRCDAFAMEVAPRRSSVEQLTYWLGLFSHRRAPAEWKGLLVVPLEARSGKDQEAELWLSQQGDPA